MIRTFIQWVLFSLIMATAMLAIIVLGGESETIRIGYFMLCKICSIAVLYLCYTAGKYLYKKDLLPRIIIEDNDIK